MCSSFDLYFVNSINIPKHAADAKFVMLKPYNNVHIHVDMTSTNDFVNSIEFGGS